MMQNSVKKVQQKNTRLIETAAMSITIPVLEEVEPELDIHSHLEFQNRDWSFRKFANCLLPNGMFVCLMVSYNQSFPGSDTKDQNLFRVSFREPTQQGPTKCARVKSR